MHISRIFFKNYRSFSKETSVQLDKGMNLLIGENNSGKSSVLQALALSTLGYEPHLSLETKASQYDELDSEQIVGFEIQIENYSVWNYLGPNAIFPIPPIDVAVQSGTPKFLETTDVLGFKIEKITGKGGTFGLDFFHRVNGGWHNGKNSAGNTYSIYRCPVGRDVRGGSVSNTSGKPDVAQQLARLQSNLYRFKAERLNISQCPFGASHILQPDARNLPECLHWLQSRQPQMFESFSAHVSRIFPSVHRVQAMAVVGQNDLEIRAWLTDIKSNRPDLTIPLSQIGSGVGQILAILYVAISAEYPMVIGIDEPNSFLHPKAVRALLQILNSLPMAHQYIVTTHSPEVIRAAGPRTIAIIQNVSGQTVIQSLNPSNLEHIKEGLASIGARLSDVYGADQVLWVEGETEELAFPKIAQTIAGINTVGVSFLKVNTTGDFESQKGVRPRMVFSAYRNLSTVGALIPPAIGFIFDSEGRKKSDMEDLVRESGGSVHFLERLCYENYLIHPDAIAFVLNQVSTSNISSENVCDWLLEKGNSKPYISRPVKLDEGEVLWGSEDWLIRVHAAKLLKALFSEVPSTPEEYRKTTHSIAITDWLLLNAPETLSPLTTLLKNCLKTS